MAIHSSEQVEVNVVKTFFTDTLITMGPGDNDDLTAAEHHEHLMAAMEGFVG